MGRDDHKGKSNQSGSLPQTPKKQIIQPGKMHEEIAKEFSALRKIKRQNKQSKNKQEHYGEQAVKRNFIIASIAYVAFIVLMLEIITAPSPEHASETPQKYEMMMTQYEDETLLEQLHSYANKNNIPPVDAKLDPIWKAVPGYNGLEVDIEESYLNMWPSKKFEKDLLIFDEVSPEVHLADLPPAPIYKGNPEKPMVTFLINVAWGNEFIAPMLETLKRHHIQATFFFDGSWVKKNPNLAKKIYEANHEIGNHAYSHPDLKGYSRDATRLELQKTNDIIKKTLQHTPKWFAPPSGSFNDNTVEIAHELNMHTILWTVDTIDWRNPETSSMVNRVISEVHPGAMILMHPTKPSAEGLEKMIQEIKKKGYKIGTVSMMMDEKRIH